MVYVSLRDSTENKISGVNTLWFLGACLLSLGVDCFVFNQKNYQSLTVSSKANENERTTICLKRGEKKNEIRQKTNKLRMD